MRRKRFLMAGIGMFCAASLFGQNGPVQASAQGAASGQVQSERKPPLRLRIGGNVQQVKLMHMVQPVYPPIAVAAKVQGTAVLHVVLAEDGTVSEVQYISGPVVLERAAMDAVKQWRYEPTLLNGHPVEVDTTVNVGFVLASGHPSPEGTGESANSPWQVAVVVPKMVQKQVAPPLRADIMQLFALTNGKDSIREGVRLEVAPLRPALIKALPDTPHRQQIADEFEQKFESLASSQEFEERLVEVYAKYFADDQVRGLIYFYQSPLGQNYPAVQDNLRRGRSAAGQLLGPEPLRDIYRDMCQDHPELRGKAKFCPALQQPGPGAAKRQ